MRDNEIIDVGTRPSQDRTVMHVLYGMHTIAPFTYWVLAFIAMVVNYVKRSDEADRLHVEHHSYMLSTFWWSIFWLVITSPLYLVFFLPGFLAHCIVGLWYLYRCIRGWMRFNDNKLPR